MASVHSPVRKLLKPILFRLLGPSGYLWFQCYGKIRDIENRLVEEPEMAILPKLLGESDVCLDVGANYAYYTVRLAKLCPKGTVYAFEPIPFTFKALTKIVHRFHLSNVALFQKGVGAQNEMMEFEVPLQQTGAISAGQAHLKGRNNDQSGKESYHPFKQHRSFVCEVVAIDAFLPALPRLDFVKLDIEGAELFALRGMKNALDKHRPVILMEICPFFLRGFGLTQLDLQQFADAAAYEIYSLCPQTKLLKAHSGDFTDGNYFWLPREKLGRFSTLMHHDS